MKSKTLYIILGVATVAYLWWKHYQYGPPNSKQADILGGGKSRGRGQAYVNDFSSGYDVSTEAGLAAYVAEYGALPA